MNPLAAQFVRMIDTLLLDLRYAIRSLRRTPGFTLAAVACLALGVGANAVMFGVIDRLFLRAPPDIQAPARLGRVYLNATYPGGSTTRNMATYPEFQRIRDGVNAFSSIAAFAPLTATFGRGGDALSVNVVMASHTFFDLMGVKPTRGRTFAPEDDHADAAPVAVLSDGFWKRQFGGDPTILGRRLDIGNRSYTVVGISPEGFTGADLNPVDVWLPVEVAGPDLTIGFLDPLGLNNAVVQIVGRLAPGYSFESAEEQATAVRHETHPDRPGLTTRVLLGPIQAARGPLRDPQLLMSKWLGVVSLVVLLIACLNVANLLFARSIRRRREVAIRLAIGVGRRRLVRQLLVEGGVLSALGVLGAVALAPVGSPAIQRLALPGAVPVPIVDSRLLLFSLGTAVVAGLLASLVPALRASRTDLAAALASGAYDRGGRRFPLSTCLLITQVALSLVLVVGAGLFIDSMRHVETIDLGFQPARLLTIHFDLKGRSLKRADNDALYQRAASAVDGVPGVQSMSVSSGGLLGSASGAGVRPEGAPRSSPVNTEAWSYLVSTTYFQTTGIRILEGRGFEPTDGAGAPEVAVVSTSLAKSAWPGQDAVGKCFFMGDDRNCIRVVGVAGEAKNSWITKPADPVLYHVYGQQDWSNPLDQIWVKTSGDANALIPVLRQRILAAVPDAPFVDIQPMQARIDPQVRPWVLDGTLFGTYGALALLLTGLGLYGVLAYSVTERTREIGIRRALGAGVRSVVGMVVRDAAGLTAVGVVIGGITVALGGKLVSSFLFGVTPSDPWVLGGAVAVLLLTGLLASWLPARRAAKIDPMVALRYE